MRVMRQMRSERSVSTVLGSVMLVGIVIAALALVAVTGMFSSSGEGGEIQSDLATRDLGAIASEVHAVTGTGDSKGEMRLDVGDEATGSGSYSVDNESERVTIEVGGAVIYDKSLGRVSWENGERRVGYTNGAVVSGTQGGMGWARQPKMSATTVREPSYELSLFRIDDASSPSLSGSATVEQTAVNNLYPGIRVPASETIVVELSTEYPGAWERAFTRQWELPDSAVSVDMDAGTVRAEIDHSEAVYFRVSEYVTTLQN